MPVIYSNNASTTLSAGINNSTTTIGIASASGFPSIGSGEYYFATIANTNNTKIEVVKVTAGTTSLTVTRAQDGTTAQAFDSGDNFQLRVTAATLEAATKTDVNITAGAISGSAISNDAIDSQHYADGSIDTAHLSADCVTNAKIANDAIDSEHYVDGSIDTAHLAADAVTGAKIADDSIDSEHYVDGSIDTAHLASVAVTGAKIANDTINSEHYVDGSIDAAHLSNDCIDSGNKIADDVINSEHYVDGSIDHNHIADGQITGAKLNSSMGDCSAKGFTAIGLDGGDYIGWNNNANITFTVNGNEEMRLEADGDLHVDGDVIAFSTTISDATLKYDINPVEFALDKINQLKGVSYKYKHNNRESAGLLAQDVEKVMPSAVKTKKVPLVTGDDKEYKTLHYDSMTAILVEAIKELTAKVKKLESK